MPWYRILNAWKKFASGFIKLCFILEFSFGTNGRLRQNVPTEIQLRFRSLLGRAGLLPYFKHLAQISVFPEFLHHSIYIFPSFYEYCFQWCVYRPLEFLRAIFRFLCVISKFIGFSKNSNTCKFQILSVILLTVHDVIYDKAINVKGSPFLL